MTRRPQERKAQGPAARRRRRPERPARGPQPFRTSLDHLLDDLGSAPVRETGSLLARWPEVVGRDLAAHTQPVGIRNGVLVVQADDPAYGDHLGWQERQLVQRLGSVLGEGVVTALQVRIRRPG